MSVYDFENLSKMPINKITNKAKGLVHLYSVGINIPEGFYLDQEEFEFYVKYRHCSSNVIEMVKDFVKGIKRQKQLPFVSIRCESKSEKGWRPPYTLLNVGVRCFDKKDYLSYDYLYDNIDEFHKQLLQTYNERVELLETFPEYNNRFFDLTDEIINWIEAIYEDLYINCSIPFDCGIILQRMVFGCINNNSGNGICCNLPGEITNKTRFQGVFLPKQQGVGIQKGCWGINEINISELLKMNSTVYFELRGVFDFLEKCGTRNPYFEFTLENNKIYILDFTDRQRFVVADS